MIKCICDVGCAGVAQYNTVQQLLLALCPVEFVMVLTPVPLWNMVHKTLLLAVVRMDA